MQLADDPQFFEDITILLVLATVIGVFCSKVLQFPSLIGFLLAGAISGPGGLSWIMELIQVETTSQIGVLLIMFGLGLEFDVSGCLRSSLRDVSIFGGLLTILVLSSTASLDC